MPTYNRYWLAVGGFVLIVWFILSSDYSPHISTSQWLVPPSSRDKVDPAATRRVKLQHPIPKLMDEAEKRHKLLLSKQSKTLRQAIAEYKKRYNREPPRGFDDWFAFAKSRGFKLVDEFDSLVADLEPFWSLPGAEIRRRAGQMGTIPAIDLVRISQGRMYVAKMKRPGGGDRVPSERANGFIMMTEPFLDLLPDMDFPISTKSEGRVIVPWEHIVYPNTTTQDSSGGLQTVIGGHFTEDWRGEGSVWDAFRRSCPPDSPARRLFGSIRGQAHTTQKSSNLLRTSSSSTLSPSTLGLVSGLDEDVDFCHDPWGRYFQGHFFSDWRTLPALYPIFSPAKAPGYNDIVIPSHYYYAATKRYTYGIDPVNMITKETDNFEVDWEEKKEQIFWRGATTGGGSSPPGFLHQYQRHRFVRMTSESAAHNTTIVFAETAKSGTTSYISASVPTSSLNKEIFDVAFTTAIGCSQYRNGGCEQMKRNHRFSSAVQLVDRWKYKYLMDVDGMGYSARFLAYMASESAVLKTTVYREFFSDWIEPWLHFIPVSQSYADLYNIHAYFSGPSPSTVDVARANVQNFTTPVTSPDHEGDRRLRKIARAGRHWKRTMTRREDMEVYVFRLCIEWARLWSDDRNEMGLGL